MKTQRKDGELFDETQSIRVIREMLEVSQRKLQSNGILFIVWGWLMFAHYIYNYLQMNMVITYHAQKVFSNVGRLLAITVIGYSIFYIIKQRRRVQTYIGISLRYVWISLLVCLSLTNLIIFNVQNEINFELQHPIFMVFIAFAIVITGGIMRYRLVFVGGVAFGLLAYASSFFPLKVQLLLEAAAWVIAFIIPGHILYAKRKK